MSHLSLRVLIAIALACLCLASPANAQTGACCMPDGSCLETLAIECTVGGTFFEGVPCGPEGACCLPDGSCLEGTTQVCCQALGGCFIGANTSCPSGGTCSEFGACCLPNGDCQESVSRECCSSQGGCFQGVGSICNGIDCTGACCLPDGTCVQLTKLGCGQQGGEFRGFNTECGSVICSTTGACCLADGTCLDTTVTPGACDSMGGQYMGFNTSCADIICRGACCLTMDDGSCVPDISREDCENMGGAYQGYPREVGGVWVQSECPPAGTDCWCEVDATVVEGPQRDTLQVVRTADVPKFDPMSGDRVLESVEIAIDGRVILMATITTSAGAADDGPTELGVTEQVIAQIPGLAPPPVILPIVDESMNSVQCLFGMPPLPGLLPPGCSCDYGGTLIFESPGSAQFIPTPAQLSEFILGAMPGSTVAVEVLGNGNVDVSATKFTLQAFPHRVEATVTVTYCFAPTGACCLPDGTCIPQLTEDDCVTNNNGSWLGPFEPCSPNVGGCCLPDDSCMVMNEACCLAAGGFFAGAGTTCDIGACCIGPACEQVTEACCLRDGGVFIGGACAPLGGCCLPDGSCIITTVDCCLNANGFYAGDGTTCDVGACCLPSGLCIETTEACCVDPGGNNGTFIGGTCAPTGACCLPDGSCIVTTQVCCEGANGFFGGVGTTCELGACCLDSGVCVQRDEACCLQDGGTFIGGPCQPLGGCCLPDGSCIVTTPFCCANENGFYAGDGTDCEIGACCIDGGCTQMSEACCIQDGGTFVGGACAPLGGCCLPDDSCIVTSQECCELAGGYFAGAGSTCDEGACCLPTGECVLATEACCEDPSGLGGSFVGGPCGPVGGCCLPDGSCIITTQQCCAGAGGFYAGDGSTCDLGACCLPSGECIQATEACCADPSGNNGTFIGGPCGPLGGCCLPDGSCIITTAQCCAGAGGFYAGDGSTCDTGACCLPSGDCIQAPEACCVDPNGNNGTFVGGPCGPLGGCCLPDGSCIITTVECCENANGFYAGDGTTCDTGACCLDGGCSQQTEACCLQAGGVFVGGDCAPLGGCCLPDGSCIVTIEQCCTLEGGVFAGPGSTCDDGACCLPSGECIVTSEACCVDPTGNNGTFIGGDCAPTGGCCLPDDSCIVTTQTCCEAAGGFFAGDNTGCIVGSCCLPDGSCVETSEACCVDPNGLNGTFVGGPCGMPGACCLADGADCIDAAYQPCCELMGGVFAGEGVPCGVTGTCCRGDNCISDIYQGCCVNFLGPGIPCDPNPCVQDYGGCDEKGSLVILSKIEIRWDAAGNLIQDTFLQLSNDYPQDVTVKLYFVNGDPPLAADPATGERAHPGWNTLNNRITLTNDQPTYWSALTGRGGNGPSDPTFSPFTVLDPGFPPGRPDPEAPGERMLRGFIVAWAVDVVSNVEIRWNHLFGNVTLVNYRDSYAWEYRACGFPVIVGVGGLPMHGQPTGMHPGELHLDNLEYRAGAAEQLMNFQAVGSTAFSGPVQIVSNTDVTIHPLDVDLRQETDGPVSTEANFNVWNMNESKISGSYRCVTCWDQTLLSNYNAPNNFTLMALQTDHGKARIDGIASVRCDQDTNGDQIPDVISQPAALVGLTARLMRVDGGVSWAADGTNMFNVGAEGAVIRYDVGGGTPENMDPPRTREEVDAFIDRLINGRR